MHDARGGRSAPTVWNAAFLSAQFWDGRAATLEDQAKGPITNPIEMGMSDAKVAVERIKAIPAYLPLFKTVFPGSSDPITMDNLAKAIAAYERTLINPDTPYDRYINGDKKALNAQQVRGYADVLPPLAAPPVTRAPTSVVLHCRWARGFS
jgi:cytochrome c peroxidase